MLEKPQKSQKYSITLDSKALQRNGPRNRALRIKQLETGQCPLTLKTSYTLPQPEED